MQAPKDTVDLDETDKTSILMEVDDKPGALHEVSDTWAEDLEVLLFDDNFLGGFILMACLYYCAYILVKFFRDRSMVFAFSITDRLRIMSMFCINLRRPKHI